MFALLDKNGALGLVADLEDEASVYLAVFGLVFADATVPIFPGETTLTTASVAASQGALELAPVIVVGALGAVLGDSALYWIARESEVAWASAQRRTARGSPSGRRARR